MKIKSIIWLLIGFMTFALNAQQRKTKTSQTFKVAKDVTVDLNTSYVEIEVDTWSKSSLEIEAYVEGKQLSDKELQIALDSWGLDVDGSTNLVSITSKGSYGSWDHMADMDLSATMEALADLEIDIANIPEVPEMPEMPHMEIPEMPEMPEMPELPELPEGINEVQFDTEAYRNEGESYLEEWSKEYEEKYGKDYKEKMKAWARKMEKVDFSDYEKRMEAWGEKFGQKFGDDYAKKMEAWGKEFEKRFDGEWQSKMEAWGERYGEQMERRAELMEKRLEAQERRHERMVERSERMADRQRLLVEREAKLASKGSLSTSSKVKRVIKIKMPKDAKVKMNVRHGELKFSSVIHNLKASISHASLLAKHIDGDQTSINVSYSPIYVDFWTMGELTLNYVENADLKTVGTLVLSSNSSNIDIGTLTGNAVIDGSFGDLTVANISDSFNNLSIILENSDALISLPKVSHHFQFKGNRSSLQHPKMTSKDSGSSFSSGNLSSQKTIVVNAKLSEVTME